MRHKTPHLIAFIALLLPLCAAATPKLAIKALSPTSIELPASNETIAVYSITNTSQHTLNITPDPSLTLLKGPRYCKANTSLAPKAKCLLVFKITPESQNTHVEICYQSEANKAVKCIEPDETSRLTVHHSNETKALLTLTDDHYLKNIPQARPLPKTVSLACPIYLIQGSTADRILQIRNNSTSVTATNIQITNLSLLPGVTQNASGCASVAPGATCTLTVNASAASPTATQSLTIAGSNTTSLSVPMYVRAPLAIDEAWEGGFIYEINADGSSGKVAVNPNFSDFKPWANINYGVASTYPRSSTNGLYNTNLIIQRYPSELNIAPRICWDYSASDACETYSDFYLPAIDELEGFANSTQTAVSVQPADYWSSTLDSISTQDASYYNFLTTSVGSTTIFTPNYYICIKKFAYSAPTSISAVSASTGPTTGGTGITLTGTGLHNASSVTFGSTPASLFEAIDDTTIHVVSPPHAAGAVNITVSTPTSNATLTNGFTYTSASLGQSVNGGNIMCLGTFNLIAATTNHSTDVMWGGFGTPTFATSDTNGALNTTTITSTLGAPFDYAAGVCSTYEADSQGNSPCQPGFTCYNDWFLPAKDQLNCLYTNRNVINGFFPVFIYWSSTESDNQFAWSQVFSTIGSQSLSGKSNQWFVRCVRSYP